MSLCKRVSRTTSGNIGESTLHEQIQVVVLRTEHEHYGRAIGGMNMGVWELAGKLQNMVGKVNDENTYRRVQVLALKKMSAHGTPHPCPHLTFRLHLTI